MRIVLLVLGLALVAAAPVRPILQHPVMNADACAAIAALDAYLGPGNVGPPRILSISTVGNFAYATYTWGDGAGPALLVRLASGWQVIRAGGGDEMTPSIIAAFGAAYGMLPGMPEALVRTQRPPPPCAPPPIRTAIPMHTARPPTPRPIPTPYVSLEAPEDRGYGRLRLTPTGMIVQASCVATRLRTGVSDIASELRFTELIEGSVRDMEAQYPKGHGVPRRILDLEIAYGKANTSEGHRRALAMHTWLITHYPKSSQARVSPSIAAAMPPERTCNLRPQDRPTPVP